MASSESSNYSASEDDYYDDYDEDSAEELFDQDYNSKSNIHDKIFGKNSTEQQGVMSAREKQIYCAICAGKHSEVKCPNKVYSKNQQLSSVRDRFAQATSFK